MGQGDAGRFPVKKLIDKYGGIQCTRAWVRSTSDAQMLRWMISGKDPDRYIPAGMDVVVLLDIVQSLEGFACGGVRNGRELYERAVRPRILEFIGMPQVSMVIVCTDCSKNENRAKEVCYYTERPKGRRFGAKPMPLQPRQIVLDDTHFPVDPDAEPREKSKQWTAFKCNEMARRQINYYFAHKFAMETVLPQYDGQDYGGKKVVLFDNCLHAEHQFAERHPNAVPYHAKNIEYLNGTLVGRHEISASNIAEGEYAMASWVTNYTRRDAQEGVKRAFACVTVDQDIIPLMFLSHEDRWIDGEWASRPYTLMMSLVGPRGNQTKQTTVFDVNEMVSRIKMHHRVVEEHDLGVEVEMALLLLGGCDNFKKPFRGIGYEKCMYAEFVEKMKSYARMFRVVSGPSRDTASRTKDRTERLLGEFQLLDVDLGIFTEFAKCVRRRRKRSITESELQQYVDEGEEQWCATVRNMMYTMLVMRVVPRARAMQRLAIMIDPFLVDAEGLSVWGYKEAVVPGGPDHPVCVVADRVSRYCFANYPVVAKNE